MFNSVHNPDPKALHLKVTDGENTTHLVIPAKSAVVVSQKVASQLQANHAQLEVSEASEEQYKAHRVEKDAQEKAQAILDAANAKKLAKVPKVDPKEHENFLAREVAKLEEKAKQAFQAALAEEQKVVEQVKKTTARLVGDGSLPTSMKAGK